MTTRNGGGTARRQRGTRRAAAKALDGTPQARAVVVGINEYGGDGRNNLNSCVADAQSFVQLLREAYGFTEIRELHDEEATLSNIRDGLDWLVADATAEDRLVYFHSSHGHHLQQGDSVEEVLVVRSDTPDKPFAFLQDDELSSRTQNLPPGVLTIVLDTCYSGGMTKVLFTEDEISLARAKVWVPEPEDAPTKEFSAGELSYKIFGRAPIRNSTDLAQFWNLPEGDRKAFAVRKDLPDEAGQVEVNALLLAACQEDETASAGTPRTNNLSAFTYGLLSAIDRLGPESSAQTLVDEAIQILQDLHMRQTPLVANPPQPPDMASRSFVTLDAVAQKSLLTADLAMEQLYHHIGTAVARALVNI